MSLLSAIAGGDAINILVTLENLSKAGFAQVQGDLAATGAEADVTSGKLSTLASGALGILAIGLAAVGGIMLSTIPTYEKIQQENEALATAFKDHGESIAELQPRIDALVGSSVQYGYTADDVRTSVLQLTNAGLSFAQIQKDLPQIMDLARVKHLSLADAATAYTQALFGNARAMKTLGIILPAVSASSADLGKQEATLTKAEQNLKIAKLDLAAAESAHISKTTTAAQEADKLAKAHLKVTNAETALKKAEDAVTLAKKGGVDIAQRQDIVNTALTAHIAGQDTSVTNLQVAQAKLNDAWENFATNVGPLASGILTNIVSGLATAITNGLGVAQAFSDMIGRLSALQPVKDFFFDLFTILGDIGTFITGTLLPAFGTLASFVAGALSTAFNAVFTIISDVVTIVNNALDAVKAILSLIPKLPSSPLNTGTGSGKAGGGLPVHAAGGWVGLHGQENISVGEQGPEFINPNGGGSGGVGGPSVHVVNVYLDGKQVSTAVEKRMARNYRLAAVTSRPYGSY